MQVALGLYALYLLLVAINGNGSALASALQDDAPGFLPWLIAALVIGGLYEFDKTRQFAVIFLTLVILTYVLRNFSTLKAQFAPIFNTAVATPTTPSETPGPVVTQAAEASLATALATSTAAL